VWAERPHAACAAMIRSPVGAILVLACLIDVRMAAAQVAGGSISGVVTDAQGGALPGVALTVAASSVSRTGTTDVDGSYRVSDLAPGTDTVPGALQGFSKLVREKVVGPEGRNLRHDLVKSVGGINEVVDVKGDTPMIESKSAVDAVNIAGDLQRALPLSALRTWADALTVVPGVATSQARLQTYSLYGTQHPSGVALID